MPQITVEILTRGEPSLYAVLDGLKSQQYEDFIAVILDSSNNGVAVPPGLPFKVKHVHAPANTSLMEGRFLAHAAQVAEFALILDSTRIPKPGLFDGLMKLAGAYDSIIVREGSIGDSYWATLAALDKSITSNHQNYRFAVENLAGFVLPRFFRYDLLTKTFERIKSIAGADRFREIGYWDHHLIFGESQKLGATVGFTEDTLIDHLEDATIGDIIRKYRRYGRSQGSQMSLPNFDYAKHQTAHRRSYRDVPLLDILRVQPLYLVRGMSFALGLIQG